jgi:hypothetical protein
MGPELKYVMMAHLELTGNFYWLLDGVKSDTDQPRAVYPLNPGRVRVNPVVAHPGLRGNGGATRACHPMRCPLSRGLWIGTWDSPRMRHGRP